MEGLSPKLLRELIAALTDAEFIMRQAGKYAWPMRDSFNRSAADAREVLAKAQQFQQAAE